MMRRIFVSSFVFFALALIATPTQADHLGDPSNVSGAVVTSVTLDDLVGILELHGYAFSGDNYGGWHFVTPNGRDMFLNLEACHGDSCKLLRINGYWDLTGRNTAIAVGRGMEAVMPSASVALYVVQGQAALVVRRDLSIDLGVTTDNLVANFDMADRNVGLMHEALVGTDPGLPAYWESLR